jgi:hypothetical protein
MAWLLLIWLGCAHRNGAGDGHFEAAPVVEVAGPVEEVRPPVVGPMYWWDATGACLQVPEGWRGLGAGAAGVLLTVVDQQTGVTFEVLTEQAPTDFPGLVQAFTDVGTYHDLPELRTVAVETWVSDLPGGETLHVWHAIAGEQPVRLVVRFPFGRIIEGTQRVDLLLAGLCYDPD